MCKSSASAILRSSSLAHVAICNRPIIWFLAYGVSTVHDEGVTNDKACEGAAKPKNRIGDFFGATKSADGDLIKHCVERLGLTTSHHMLGHRREDKARTDGVDADTDCGVFQGRALCEPDHAMLGGLIGAAPR